MTWLCHACFILFSLIKASEAVRTVQDNGRGLKKLEPNELLEIINHCYPDHTQQTQRRRRQEAIGTGNSSESGDAETGAAVLEERIYDGQLAARGEFPATVSVSLHSQTIEYVCGGTLITRRHVITAAHCFADIENLNNVVEIRVQGLCREGERCQTVMHQNDRMRRVDWKNVYWQRDYEDEKEHRFNDLAIIDLKDPVTIVPGALEFACIWPGTMAGQQWRRVYFTGWGHYERPTLNGVRQGGAPQDNWQSPISEMLRKGVQYVNSPPEILDAID